MNDIDIWSRKVYLSKNINTCDFNDICILVIFVF